uniref:Complex I assembly factor TIMMDC1, mitochondrial n=1 Tax=Panagrellus redivivus TaxID=6233 RepID=A0A7E4V505_PANRE
MGETLSKDARSEAASQKNAEVVVAVPVAEPAPASLDDPITLIPIDETGLERLKRMYVGEGFEMELDATVRMTRTAFFVGFFFGGFGSAKDAHERYERHAAGKTFINKRDAIRRRWDYGTVMFAKNGFKMGIRAAAIAGSVIALTTHATVYFNHYSPAYFPAFSALACGVFAFPLGIVGQIQALGLGTVTGSMLGAVSWLYALSVDKPVAEAYKEFKREYEEDMKVRNADEIAVDAIMKEEGYRLRILAYRRLHEKQRQKLEEAAKAHDA